MTEEEQRAIEYRVRYLRREAYRRVQLARLAGSPAAAQRVRDDWQPLIDALADVRGTGGTDVKDR